MEYSDPQHELVEACRRGTRKAQFELYRQYSKAMYNTCLRMLHNVQDAEDILQQSFVDVFSKLHTFKGQSTIGVWIKRIVINNCINFLKKRRLKLVPLEDWQGNSAEEPEELILARTDVADIKAAIQKLPDGYRIVFNLYLLEGYDHQEIADILEVSVATSKSQYSRAKKKLRQLLQHSG